MPARYRLWFTSALAGCVIAWPTTAWSAAPAASLAESVPADARLFLELRGPKSLWARPAHSVLARLLAGLVPTTSPASATRPAETRPAENPFAWRKLFTNAVGLDNPKAADLLFTGPLALAADGWSGLGDAILLARPREPARLEAELGSRRELAAAGGKVRRYRLAQDHELACDGQTVVVGRSTNRSGIYLRTIALWESDRGISLQEVAEFRERTSGLPPGAQLILYAGTNSRSPAPGAVLGPWWPAGWPPLRSAAAGVAVSSQGVIIETNGRLEAEGRASVLSAAPVPFLLRLPASAVIAWTNPIDYVDLFHRLDAAYPDGVLRVLQSRLPPHSIEERLLKHLVGDSLLMIGRVKAPSPPGQETAGDLLFPVAAVAVETDDPHTVESMLGRLAVTFLESLDLDSLPPQDIPIEFIPLGPGGEGILSIPLGRLLASGSKCPFLRSLEISWMVADRWLVVGTHAGTVGDIVRARRGQGESLPAEVIPEAMREASRDRSACEMLLVARPQAVSEMMDSWLAYVSRHHAEMLRPEWWHQLRRKQRLGSVQLGVVPTTRVLTGQVEVGGTLPTYPAHGRVQPGDRILAVDGEALDADEPLPSLREKLAMREQPDAVTLRVLRAGHPRDVEIPMPAAGWDSRGLQPVELIRQAADVLRLFSSATYAVWRPSPGLVNARLELHFASAPSDE